MKKLYLVPILVVSSILFSACNTNSGELVNQAFQRTSPKGEEEVSIAPVTSAAIDGYGTVLTDLDGKPLYHKQGDTVNVATCYDECALAWPPLLVDKEDDVSGEYSTVERKDGRLQVVFGGRPLYRYTPDKPNEVTGDGYKDIWSVVTLEEAE